MIIWGSRGREKCVSQGQFFCPNCDTSRPYKHIRVSKYFTLYFVPLFEIETLGEYIECQDCHRTFKMEALGYQPPSRAERVLAQLRAELESGMPLHMIQKKLMGLGIEEQDALRLIELATAGNERTCRACGFTYLGTIRVCPNCGMPIDPVLGPPAEPSAPLESEIIGSAAVPPNSSLTEAEKVHEDEKDSARGGEAIRRDELDSPTSTRPSSIAYPQTPRMEDSAVNGKPIVAPPPATAAAVRGPSFEGLTPSSMGRRFFAFLVDIVALWLLYFALYFILNDEEIGAAGAIPYLYFVMLWAFAGTTLGKWAMGISLVKKDGTAPGFLRANIRFFVMFLLSVLWITWWPALLRDDRRALHDLAAGTMVVPRPNQKVNAPALVFISIVAVAMLWSVKDYIPSIGGALRQPLQASQRPAQPSPSIPLVLPMATTTRIPNPTSTAQVPTKPRPLATATPTPEATLTSASLFADDFIDNRNGWPNSETAYLESGRYHVRETNEGYSYWVDCRECGPFSDFVYEAMISKVEGPDDDAYGLQFRKNGDTHYALWISADGYWQFTSYTGDWNELTDWARSPAINKGNSRNKLRVVARGSHFEFYVNDQFLGSAEDQAFPSSGNLGFGVGSAGLHIAVEYVRVWRPPSTAAMPPSPTHSGDSGIPAGMGGVVVDNYCGFEVNLDIAGQFYTIPANGKIYIHLPPNHYPVSATAAGEKFACGGGGCSLDIAEGTYTPFAYCVSSE
jgi:uncharacterized RDD family membrane protein YckC